MIDKQVMNQLKYIKSNLMHPLTINEYINELRHLVQIKPIQKQIVKFFLSNNIYQDYQIPCVIQHKYNDEELTKFYEKKVQSSPFDFFRIIGRNLYPFSRLESLYLLDVLQSKIYRQQAKVQSEGFNHLDAQPRGVLSRAIVNTNGVENQDAVIKHEGLLQKFMIRFKRFVRDFFWED